MASLDASDIEPERFRPLSRSDYDRMVEMGLFDEDERVELLAGALVARSAQKARHADVVRRLTETLARQLEGRAQLRVQLPLGVGDYSEPEPDIAVVPLGDYSKAHPTEALLVIEVADTTLRKDRGAKALLYAEGGVPEYWLVNLVDDVVEVHLGPTPAGYREVTIKRGPTTHVPTLIDGVGVQSAEIFA